MVDVFRFESFEVDRGAFELRRAGRPVPIERIPMELLLLLLERHGQLVTRQEILDRIWGKNVFGDVDNSINTAVRKIRQALHDSPASPRLLHTIPGKGYRMTILAPAGEGIPHSGAPPSHTEAEEENPNSSHGIATLGAATAGSRSATLPEPPRSAKWGPLGWVGGALMILAGLAAFWAITHYRGVAKSAAQTSSAITSAAIQSLAVLPLENLSGDKDQEYFADGMTDALTTDLAQIGSLRVISRTSAVQFKGTKETLPQIGHDLQVDAVVEGSVTRSENRVRITAQLIEASSDHHLWAKSYERDLKDILALQDEIAQDITEQIRVKLTPKERSQLIQLHAVDPEAYDAYLRGRYWFSVGTSEGAWKARDYFQKAIAKDPSYALAYAELAASFIQLSFSGELPYRETIPKAKQAVAQALTLDPALAEGHTQAGWIKFNMDWDWSGAEAEYKQATALNPNNASAHYLYSEYLLAMGRVDQAMQESERAEDLDPLFWKHTWWLGQVLYHARRYDEALRQDRRGLEMHPAQSATFYDAMADVYEQKKMFAEAFAARQQTLRLMDEPSVTALGEAYARSGYRGYLLKQAQVLDHNPGSAAHVYALLNDEARAMTALEAGYNERWSPILFLRTAPELDSIRSSPRFRNLVRRIGFPQSSSDGN